MLTRITILASMTTALIIAGVLIGPAPAAVESPTPAGEIGSGIELPLDRDLTVQTWRIER